MEFYDPKQHESVEIARELIERWTGFELRPSTPQRIYALLEGRCAALNFPAIPDYLRALSNLSSTDDEPQRLINLITNGLTAFWRDEAQLEGLRMMMEKIATPQRPLQIWCAGCSTGEEPFTIAMLAREANINAQILGTDINTDFLRHARQGTYGPWSLRRLSQQRRQQFFTQLDARSWQIHPDLQSIVTFQHHNLLDPPPRAPFLFGQGNWDIILCRNVLIYLTAQATERIYYHFSKALTPGGYLLLSSSEQISPDNSALRGLLSDQTSTTPNLLFIPTRSGNGFVYTLASHVSPHTKHPAPEPDPAHQFAPTLPYTSLTPDDFAFEEIPPPPIPAEEYALQEITREIEDTHTVLDLLINAAQHLQKGNLDTAITCFEAALTYDPFVPEAYCLIGKALYESGAHQLASEAFRKALFLEPHNWYAASQMADLMMTIGSQDAARQAWRQTLEGLNTEPDPLADAYILLQFIKPLADYRTRVGELARAYLQNDHAS